MKASEHPFLPSPVRKVVDQLQEATGHEPEVERPTGRWRVIMRSPRVLMTYDIKTLGRGRSAWAGSTLTIDGARRLLATDFDDFVRIWKDPDCEPESFEDKVDQAAALMDVPTPPLGDVSLPPIVPVPLAEVPPGVRELYDAIAGKIEKLGDVQVGRNGTNWVIGFDNGGIQYRAHFHQGQGGKFTPIVDRPLELVIDGIDYTDHVGGDLTKALGVLTKKPGVNTPPPVRGKAPAKVASTGVQTRKTTVIRV